MIYKFSSADLGAPTLSGTVGHLINVLDACLLNGYNNVAVSSMTRSGSVVTVTTSAPHGFTMFGTSTPTGPIVEISGAGESAYNGKWEVASVTSTTVFTFNIGAATPATPATGSISSKRAALGWTKPFSGTNKAVYRLPAGTNQFYLRVDDNAPTGGDAKCVAVRGYESMSDVDTGTGPFPTAVQEANGRGWGKSNALSTATRPWLLFSDGYFIWLGVSTANTTNYTFFGFGDFPSYKAGDVFNTLLNAGSVSTSESTTTSTGWQSIATIMTTTVSATFVARAYNQLGSAVQGNFCGDNIVGAASIGGNGMTYPAPVDNGLYVSKLRLNDASSGGVFRGEWPGLYQPLHNRPGTSGDIVENLVGLTGKVMQIWHCYIGGSQQCSGAFDLTGPWR